MQTISVEALTKLLGRFEGQQNTSDTRAAIVQALTDFLMPYLPHHEFQYPHDERTILTCTKCGIEFNTFYPNELQSLKDGVCAGRRMR